MRTCANPRQRWRNCARPAARAVDDRSGLDDLSFDRADLNEHARAPLLELLVLSFRKHTQIAKQVIDEACNEVALVVVPRVEIHLRHLAVVQRRIVPGRRPVAALFDPGGDPILLALGEPQIFRRRCRMKNDLPEPHGPNMPIDNGVSVRVEAMSSASASTVRSMPSRSFSV
jgi:hypothetical protein